MSVCQIIINHIQYNIKTPIFPPKVHHLQGSGLLQGRAAVQPGSVQSGFGFLQLVQGLLDLCLRTVAGPDQTQTEVPNRVDALGTGVDLRLKINKTAEFSLLFYI